jgi:hypothetical protein
MSKGPEKIIHPNGSWCVHREPAARPGPRQRPITVEDPALMEDPRSYVDVPM